MKVKMSFHGVPALKARLARAAAKAPALMLEACTEVLEQDVFPETQRQVPIDTGALRSTGRVVTQSSIPSIVYGGQAEAGHGGFVNYAFIQHERLDFNHPKGGKAKYVEDPMNEAASVMGPLLFAHLDENELLGG